MSRPASRIHLAAAAIILFALAPAPVQAQTPATSPGALRSYSTIYSIGVEWDIAGDANHNAVASVDYRVAGTGGWKDAMPLMRVDYNAANMLAGSVLFLTPRTSYEIRLTLTDPDGGAAIREVTQATRALPALPAAGRTMHVIPGTGGGLGTAADPFKGIAVAQAAAQAGDILLVHAGNYGGRIRFDKPGAVDNYLVWKAAGDGEVTMNGIDIAASHIWLEGLTVRNQTYATFSIAAPDDVVVSRCGFYNNHYSIYLQQGGTNWYIADNTIVGDTDALSESFDGEGIELNQTSGHTVAHNSITNVADGISYPLRNVDILGNDIFDTSDDGIEGDYGYANVRMWGNRIHNAVHNGISFQPQYGAPWYIIRNQIISNKEAPFKFRTTDRFVLLHNTIVNWGDAYPGENLMCCNDHHLFGAVAKNNLWVLAQAGQIWRFGTSSKDWRTDFDHNGFDWGAGPNPFLYAGVTYATVPSFSAASGLEAHGIAITKASCFDQFDVRGPSPTSVPPQSLTLQPSCNAIDAGIALPNVSDVFNGLAPDLGAHEFGTALRFGPRALPAATLSASPTTIQPGQPTTLSWSTREATNARIDPSVGAVDLSGSAVVSPDATTTYTLLATGVEGAATVSVTVTVAAPPAPVPAAPTELTGRAVTITRIDLAWRDNSDGETGFAVERSIDGKTFVQVATVGAGLVNYMDTGLRQNRIYHYRVRAFNTAGSSAFSNVVTTRTLRK
ncbi:MAG: right-handed parallel beta-helix repeat-containing protein [Acidobacteriota bacterium]|nr:right-handed parallel beta-helix repeat-containing protein [Acidobacteriota bacterium]